MAEIWDASETSCTVDGNEADGFLSFEWDGAGDEVNAIKGPKGVTGFEYKAGEPSWTLKLQATSKTLPLLYALRDNKKQFPITFLCPNMGVNCIESVVKKIKEGAVGDKAPEVQVDGLAMKIEEKPVTR